MADVNGTGNQTNLGSISSGRNAADRAIPERRSTLNRRTRANVSSINSAKLDSTSTQSNARNAASKALRSKTPESRAPRSKTPNRTARRRSKTPRLDIAKGGRNAAKRSGNRNRANNGSNGAANSAANNAAIKATVIKPAEGQAGGKLVPIKKATKTRRRMSRRKMPRPLLWMIWFVVVGLGISVIGGTLLKAFSSSSSQTVDTSALEVEEPTVASTFPVELNQEIAPLKAEMQELPNLYPDLTPKAFYIDVDTGDYVNLEGSDTIASASTIKLPILLAFFDEVDAGRIRFEQTVEMLPEQIADGSGDMQFAEPGTRFTALEVATQMIVTSDNTATNMMIDLLGGRDVINERFESYGLEKTQLNAALPDVEGTNTTSAKDLVRTMLMISGDRLSLKSRDRIFNILNRTHNKDLLASGMVQKEALTYNKTGYIGAMLGDVALVDLANGKRYIVAALVERPRNDNRATELIHRISDMTYAASDAAIRPSVTPLGNLESNSDSNSDGSLDSSAGNDSEPASVPSSTESGVEITPVEAAPALEEEPYPSANP